MPIALCQQSTRSLTPGPSPLEKTRRDRGREYGSLVALRYNQWKIVFQEQRAHGFEVWSEPFVALRVPKLFNLRTDPFEIADQVSIDYDHWRLDRVFMFVPAQEYIGKYIATFKEFPPSQKVGSFSLDNVLQALAAGLTSGK
jgi:arylsulfatase